MHASARFGKIDRKSGVLSIVWLIITERFIAGEGSTIQSSLASQRTAHLFGWTMEQFLEGRSKLPIEQRIDNWIEAPKILQQRH